jgi:3(or 17)beta-hydroxysteroid dehydrogenase
MKRFEGRAVLISGAAGGIGLATAARFAREGAAVVMTDIDEDRVAAEVRRIAGEGGRALAVRHDVTSEASWAAVMEEARDWLGRLDVLVNNAGVASIASIEDISLADWRRVTSVNLDGVFLGTRSAIDAMKQNGGAIINVSSIEGIVAEPLLASYNASKGGVRIFTKSAALHCAAQGYAIRINSIHPGYVVTPMVSGAAALMPAEAADAFLRDVISRIPVGRMGRADEIAGAIAFLASDDASYMTGSELIVDGGYTAR